MVTIGMNYFVVPGKEQVFENACANVVRSMEGIEGHDASHIYRQVGDGEPTYLIVSRWSNQDAFDGFIASEASKNNSTRLLSGTDIETS